MDRRKLQSEVGTFVRQYGRRRGANGMNSNDRSYSRKVEQALKRLRPEELDELLRGGPDEDQEGQRRPS